MSIAFISIMLLAARPQLLRAQFCLKDWQPAGCIAEYGLKVGATYAPRIGSLEAWDFAYDGYYYTSDGGITWQKIRSIEYLSSCQDSSNMPVMNPVQGNGIFAYSRPNTLFLSSGGPYLKSTDKGKTWSRIKDEYAEPWMTFPLNDSIGYWLKADPKYFGDSVEQSGDLYKTTNGGASWFQLPIMDTGAGYPQIHFQDDNNGLLFGGNTYRTSNGGRTWDTLRHPFWPPNYTSPTYNNTPESYSEYFSDINHAWAVPRTAPEGEDSIRRTTDGGRTWRAIVSSRNSGLFDDTDKTIDGFILVDSAIGVSGWFFDTTIVKNGVGAAFAYDSLTAFLDANNSLYRTTDGGFSWQPVNAPWMTNLWFHSKSYISTINPYGTWRTTDGGATWAASPSCIDTPFVAPLVMIDSCWGWGGAAPLPLNAAPGATGMLAYTRDGGQTVHAMSVPQAPPWPVGGPIFLNRRIGWVPYVGGGIIYTSNGGKTWARRDLPLPYNINDIAPVSPDTAFVSDGNTALWETTNAGVTWVRIFSGYQRRDSLDNGGGITSFLGHTRLAPRIIYYYRNATNTIYKTTNGGISWDTLPIPAQAAGCAIYGFILLNADTLWLEADCGIYISYNGGNTWSFFEQRVYGVTHPIDTKFMYGAPGTVGDVLTTDGGATWQQLPVAISSAIGKDKAWGYVANRPIVSVRWTKDTNCCRCVYNEPVITPDMRFLDFDTVLVGANKTLALSIANAGAEPLVIARGRFTSADSELTMSPPSLSTVIIAPGDSIAITFTFTPVFAGAIQNTLLITSNDTLEPVAAIAIRGVGVNQVSVREGMLPTQTVAAYPNPFSGTTNVEFRIPNEELVTLCVYNVLGEKVATLVSERLAPGNYTAEWNAKDMPPGVYVVKGNFGAKQFVQKLAVEK